MGGWGCTTRIQAYQLVDGSGGGDYIVIGIV